MRTDRAASLGTQNLGCIVERVFAPNGAAAWKDTLNPAQLEAVTAGDGPLLVIAGAGTGKTWTLACRVAYLIDQAVAAERILLLTFSLRASREMVSLSVCLVDRNDCDKDCWR